MAIINYGFTFVPVGTANEEVTATADIVLPSPSGNYFVDNDTEGSSTAYPKAQSFTIIAFDIYNPITTFKNGVYHVSGSHVVGPDTYDGDGYFLNIVDLEADIAAYPTATLMDQNMIVWFNSVLLAIDNAWLLPNYATVSANIINGQNGLTATPNSILLISSSALTSPTNIEVTVDPTNGFGVQFFVWANLLTNTLDGETKDFSAAFEYPVSASPEVSNVTSSGMYASRFADGVYKTELSVLDLSPGGTIYSSESYVLVTTESDLGIALYQANYDPTNATQVANLAQLLVLQALVLSEYAANDYAGANQALEDIFAILDDGIIWTDFSAALTDESNITLTFGTLPSGTYSNGSGTLTNTMTLEEYGYTGFPANSADLTEILNSVTLDAGDDYPDGVYQIAGSFTVDGVLFTYSAYVLVITDIYCGYDKIVAKASTCKFSASLQMKIQAEINMIINCFQRGDYVTANNHIRIATQMLGQSGCSCGCG